MTRTRRDQIQELADNLHIALYIREDGNAYQYPPGEVIHPRVPWPVPAGSDLGPKETTETP
jgi:hypothetical protein